MVYGIKEKLRKKQYYLRHKEKIKMQMRIWGATHKEQVSKNTREWISQNRDKFNELMRMNYWRNKKKQLARIKAIKIKIPQGTICQICHKNLAIQRHHPDYDFPLVIVFVCKSCNEKL